MRRWMAVSSRASVVSVAGADDDTLPTFNPTKVAAQCAQLVPFVDAAYNAFSDAVAPAEQTQRAAAAAMAATAAQAIAVAGARTSQAVDTMSIRYGAVARDGAAVYSVQRASLVAMAVCGAAARAVATHTRTRFRSPPVHPLQY